METHANATLVGSGCSAAHGPGMREVRDASISEVPHGEGECRAAQDENVRPRRVRRLAVDRVIGGVEAAPCPGPCREGHGDGACSEKSSLGEEALAMDERSARLAKNETIFRAGNESIDQ